MKEFDETWLTRLNATHSGGVFCKAAILVVDPMTTLRFADTQHGITFAGDDYQPLPMQWQGQEQSSEQKLPSVRVTVPNANGVVGAYLETVDLSGNDCTLQILHLDLLDDVSAVDQVVLQCMSVDWNEMAATLTLGINLALSEQLPRHVVTRAQFPGVPDSLRRASIL